MKKVFFILSAALFAMVACNKSADVATPEAGKPGEIRLQAISNQATKAGELDGELLNKDYGIYAAATQKNAAGLIENASFFSGNECLFACTDDPMTAASQWKASPAQYWPIGGTRLDFLAYAQLKEKHAVVDRDWKAVWDNYSTDVASQLTFYDVDTYANQEDILYAVANGMTRDANSPASGEPAKTVPMTFEHAQALLIFNVKINSEGAGQIQIDEISFVSDARVAALRTYQNAVAANVPAHSAWEAKKTADGYDGMDADGKAAWDAANPEPTVTPLADLADEDVTLKTIGDFRVNNSRNNLVAGWIFDSDACDADNYKMPAAGKESPANKVVDAATDDDDELLDYGDVISNTAYFQLGETLLIPEQDKVNFTIKYTVGGKTMYYTFNDLRGVWQMGHKYYYNLDLTVNEIVITEEVADFTAEQQATNQSL